MGAAAAGQVSANRKKFRGTLERTEAGGWQIVWRDEPAVKPGQKVSKSVFPRPCRPWVSPWMNCVMRAWRPSVDFKGACWQGGAGRCLSRRLETQDGRLPHGGQHSSVIEIRRVVA